MQVSSQPVSLGYQVQTVTDNSLPQGLSVVRHKGSRGEALLRTQEVSLDGHQVLRQVIGETVTKPAQPEIVAEGTAQVSRGATGAGGRVVKVLHLLATAYWADPSWSNGRTALGMHAGQGVVAVDPGVIPLGTHLYIPGYGPAIAGDTGSAIVGDRIDLGMNTGQEAVDFGVKWVTVDILGS